MEGDVEHDLYRSKHPAVTALWSQAGDVLKKLNAGMTFDVTA
jgi:hypothetical protein